jgi:hypothetical protein
MFLYVGGIMSHIFIETEWDKLSNNENIVLLTNFQMKMYSSKNEDLDDMIEDIHESRFQEECFCIHYRSISVKRFGKYRGHLLTKVASRGRISEGEITFTIFSSWSSVRS